MNIILNLSTWSTPSTVIYLMSTVAKSVKQSCPGHRLSTLNHQPLLLLLLGMVGGPYAPKMMALPELGLWTNPPTKSWQCQHFGCIWSPNPSLTAIGITASLHSADSCFQNLDKAKITIGSTFSCLAAKSSVEASSRPHSVSSLLSWQIDRRHSSVLRKKISPMSKAKDQLILVLLFLINFCLSKDG